MLGLKCLKVYSATVPQIHCRPKTPMDICTYLAKRARRWSHVTYTNWDELWRQKEEFSDRRSWAQWLHITQGCEVTNYLNTFTFNLDDNGWWFFNRHQRVPMFWKDWKYRCVFILLIAKVIVNLAMVLSNWSLSNSLRPLHFWRLWHSVSWLLCASLISVTCWIGFW